MNPVRAAILALPLPRSCGAEWLVALAILAALPVLPV